MKFFFAIIALLSMLSALLGVDAVDCSYRKPDCNWIQLYQPVCGTNGCTYGNSMEAACAEAAVAHDGECSSTC